MRASGWSVAAGVTIVVTAGLEGLKMTASRKSSQRAMPGPHPRLIVRVDLRGVSPPIWRRLDIRSDLTLDQVHTVIQAAFDWQNSHLHEFTKAKPGGGRDYTRFVGAFLLEDDVFGGSDMFGMFGLEVDESTVQLGSLLVKPKDVLDYQYDFGDSWDHKVRLERIRGSADDELPAICLGGRRAAPPDDCGGIWQYQWLIEAGLEPAHPDFGEAREQLDWIVGEDVSFDPEAFDVKWINRKLEAAAATNFQAWWIKDEE